MDDGKEDFFTSEEKFQSLICLSVRVVYYINMSTMCNLNKTVVDNYYCHCLEYSGCKKINGVMDYCDMCQLNVKHNPYHYQNDFKVKNIINKNIELTKDFKKNNVDIYTGDYTFKTWRPFFSEYSFFDSVFKDSLFIKKNTFH